MLGGDTNDCLCTRLVNPWDLVQENKGKLVLLISDLDHVAVDRIKVLRDIDSNLMLGHTSYFDRPQNKTWQTDSMAGLSSLSVDLL